MESVFFAKMVVSSGSCPSKDGWLGFPSSA